MPLYNSYIHKYNYYARKTSQNRSERFISSRIQKLSRVSTRHKYQESIEREWFWLGRIQEIQPIRHQPQDTFPKYNTKQSIGCEGLMAILKDIVDNTAITVFSYFSKHDSECVGYISLHEVVLYAFY